MVDPGRNYGGKSGGYGGNSGGYNNYGGQYNSSRQQNVPDVRPAAPEKLPEDYIDAAEEVIKDYFKETPNKDWITSTKIRRLYSLVIIILNDERLRGENTLLPESVQKLMLARVRFAYEAGRDNRIVAPFIKKAKLMEYIKGVGNSRKEFTRFASYMEALVAWHRYYGGKD